jgi:hypothetical protein
MSEANEAGEGVPTSQFRSPSPGSLRDPTSPHRGEVQRIAVRLRSAHTVLLL